MCKHEHEHAELIRRQREYAATRGSGNAPMTFVCEDGYPLGKLLSYVRKAEKGNAGYRRWKLDDDAKAMLVNFDFVIFVKKNTARLLVDEFSRLVGSAGAKAPRTELERLRRQHRAIALCPRDKVVQRADGGGEYLIGRAISRVRVGKHPGLVGNAKLMCRMRNAGYVDDVRRWHQQHFVRVYVKHTGGASVSRSKRLAAARRLTQKTKVFDEVTGAMYPIGNQISAVRAKKIVLEPDVALKLSRLGFAWSADGAVSLEAWMAKPKSSDKRTFKEWSA